MHKIFYFHLLLFAVILTSCEEEAEDLQLNDLVNQEYETKKNRLFAATINFEEFEANEVELDSLDGQWIIWAHNERKQVKVFLPTLKEQYYLANDSNGIEMRYKESGGEWYSSNWSKKVPNFNFEISSSDTALNQIFGKFEGRLYNESSKEELFVDRGVFE
jgi:hypothetical protein